MLDPRIIACRAVDSIRINSLRSEMRNGRLYWIKERQPNSALIVGVANRFFRICRNPVTIHTSLQRWRDWEVDCHFRLNGEEYAAHCEGKRAVCAAAVPGVSLCRQLSAGTLTGAMMSATGREFRRVHEVWHPSYGGYWSHSDPHSGNVIYDEETDRARLIDFETMHYPELSADERHADDLLVLLQDLVARVSRAEWLEFATLFLEAYDRPHILPLVQARLVLPGIGAARLWWIIRTACMSSKELRWRLQALRNQMAETQVAA